MRIALVTELYAPSIGGQEIRFDAFATHLVDRGHTITVYCVDHAVGLPATEVVNASVVIKRLVSSPGYRRESRIGMRRVVRSIFRFGWCLRKEFQRERFDAIVMSQWPLLHVAMLTSDARKITILDWCENRSNAFYRLFQTVLPKLVRGNIAVSRSVAQQIERQSNCPTTVIESGIEREDYRCSPIDVCADILYFGRLSLHKNVELLIDAYARLKHQGYGGRLIIAGEGLHSAALKDRAAATQCAGSIDFLGFISEAQKIDLLASAEVLVVPSRREGFPRVIAEAYASGTPVVTVDYQDNGSVSVIKEFGGGLIAPPDDPSSLAQTILDAIADRATLSEQALTASHLLGWSTLIVKLEAKLFTIRSRA